ncbi:DMT family transporter [Leptospira sp. GIMC2001]|uniref:DMT family transporter n=1 Tax=Leptospira sp. GIMC2001 TaxID=1513297 RepID=UPI00234AF93A|nr:DMT family transporter [Leptospira sp. GIMC2001]WCL50368.1 DMT family transporter [Leptospira sp. GIMC2001]
MDAKRDKFYITAEFYLVFMTIIWGGTFIFIKLSLDSLSPSLFLILRFTIALGCALIFWKSDLSKVNRSTFGIGLLVGLVMFGGYYFQTAGLEYTTATQSGFITGAYVVIIPMLESIWTRRIPKFSILLAVVIVFIGIFLISIGDKGIDTQDFHFALQWGDILTLIGAFFFALYILLIDIVSKKYHEVSLILGQLTAASILAGILLGIDWFYDPSKVKMEFSNSAWFGIFYTGVIATIVPVWVQTRFQKAVTPTRAGLIFSLEPVFASLFAFFVVGELLGVIGLIGCSIVFVGVILTSIPHKKIRNHEN